MRLLSLRECSKRELAAWLEGDYRRTLRFDRTRRSEPPPSGVRLRGDGVTATRIADIVASAQASARLLLEELKNGRDDAIESALERALVVSVETADGMIVCVPAQIANAGLSDRIIALIAVDYLARPQDFEHLLVICDACERTAFGAPCDHRESGYDVGRVDAASA